MMLGSRRTTRSATLGSAGAGGKKPPPAPLAPIKETSHQPPPVPAMAKKFAALSVSNSPPAEVDVWEVRPGGMLVQKRDATGADVAARPPPPPIRVRVKYGAASHEVIISPQASFGDLKKLLSALTGLHPQDQKLLYKDKERDSAAFLDMTGVKDRSKIVLVEDPTGQAKRLLEMSRNAKMEKAAKSIKQVTVEVDKLAKQVSSLESIIGKGKKVAENDVVSLTEQLMNQLLKLDAIVADGDVKQQRKTQVVRVQKYVETLDILKVKNSTLRSDNQSPSQKPPPATENNRNPYRQQTQQRQYQQQQKPSEPQVMMNNNTNWETFDLLSLGPSTSSATHSTMATSTPATAAPHQPPARFNWELF